jgi:hypothetical protein
MIPILGQWIRRQKLSLTTRRAMSSLGEAGRAAPRGTHIAVLATWTWGVDLSTHCVPVLGGRDREGGREGLKDHDSSALCDPDQRSSSTVEAN